MLQGAVVCVRCEIPRVVVQWASCVCNPHDVTQYQPRAIRMPVSAIVRRTHMTSKTAMSGMSCYIPQPSARLRILDGLML